MAAPPLMDGGLPNSHPSNQIYKASMALPKEKTVLTLQHEINKTAVIIGVVGIVALLFMASR